MSTLMLRLALTVILAMLLNAVIAQAVIGATTATVAATVTAQNVSVTVSSGTVTYGTLSLSASQDTTASGVNQTQTATNNGNVAEDLNILSSNATGGTGWTISGAAIGSDQYKHSFSINSGSNYTAMTTSYGTLATNIAASGTQNFDLKIDTPSSSTDYVQKSITVTVQAVAH